MISNFPKQIIKGDSVNFTDYFEDFLPSSGWYCNYVLKNQSGTIILDTRGYITTENENYVVNITSVQSDGFFPGFYNVNIVFFNTITEERKTFLLDKVEIQEDLLNSQGVDSRSWEEIALENLQNFLKDGNNLKYKSYEIKGRKLENYSTKELQEMYNWLSSLVSKNKSKLSKKGRSKIYCRFTNK